MLVPLARTALMAFLDRRPVLFPLLEEILADEAERAVFAEASRLLREAHRVEFESLLEQVRGEVVGS